MSASAKHSPGLGAAPAGRPDYESGLGGLGLLALRAFPFLCLAASFAACYGLGLFVRGDAFQAYAMFNTALANVQSAGELPQWLPYAAYGSPAEPYVMTFLGPFQLLAVYAGGLLRLTNAWALFFASTFLESAVFVAGAWLLGRELYESEITASAVAAWVAVSLYWSVQIFWTHRILLYVPLLLLFTLRFHRSGDLRQLCRLGLAGVASLVGSLAYIAPLYALLVGVFFLALRLCDRKGGFARLKRPDGAALAELALLLLAAGLYAGLFFNAFNGARFTSPDRDPVTGLASMEVFLTYGGPALLKLPDFVLGRWVGHMEYLFYLGVGGTGLVALALRRQRGGPFLALCATAGFLLLLCLGPQGLVAYAAYWFPGMNRFRHLSFLLPLLRLLLFFLAGFGLDQALKAAGKGRAEVFVYLTASALAVIVLKHALPLGDAPLSLGAFVPELGFGLLLLARGGSRLLEGRLPQALGLLLALAVTLELGGAHALLLRNTWSFFAPQEVRGIGEGLDATQVQAPPFAPGRAVELAGLPQPQALIQLTLRQPVNNFTLLQLLGADSCAPLFRIDFALPGVLQVLEQAAPGALARSNLERDPRRFLTGVNWQDALSQPWFREACGCAGDKLVLETPEGGRRDAAPGVRHFSANRLVVEVDAGPAGATLYFADAFHKGWRATVDGQPVPVALARTAFKSVAVPPGAHSVAWSFFEPWREGARRALALVLLLGLGWGGLATLRERRAGP